VRTNFTIPDVHSIALGGGSIIRIDKDRTSVGPDSVGSRLEIESIAFGGKTLTVSIFFFVQDTDKLLRNHISPFSKFS